MSHLTYVCFSGGENWFLLKSDIFPIKMSDMKDVVWISSDKIPFRCVNYQNRFECIYVDWFFPFFIYLFSPSFILN